MRTVLFGSPPFATPVLERLLESRHRVAALVARPDRPKGRGRSVAASPLAELARARKVEVLQPASPHEPEFLAHLRALEPDVLLVASYGVILKRELLELAPQGALNVHASLLPRHRGASPVQAAILAGDRETGVSVQRMVLALDEGDVLLAKSLPLIGDETAGELLETLARLGGEAAVEALDRIEAGAARFLPQDPELATYARKLEKDAGRIDWTRAAGELERVVRALRPWPGARFEDPKGREVEVLRAKVATNDASAAAPGTVLEAGARFVVATGQGSLELVELQAAGKKPLAAAEFLRGARLAAGIVLGPRERAES